MRKFFSIVLFFTCLLIAYNALAGSTSLTTYYPPPRSDVNQLQLASNYTSSSVSSGSGCTNSNVGTIFIDSASKTIEICTAPGTATGYCSKSTVGTALTDPQGTLYTCIQDPNNSSTYQTATFPQECYNSFCSYDTTVSTSSNNSCISSSPCKPGFNPILIDGSGDAYDSFNSSPSTCVLSFVCCSGTPVSNNASGPPWQGGHTSESCSSPSTGTGTGTSTSTGTATSSGTSTSTSSGGTCFIIGTHVLLANGKSVPIETVQVGDILLGSKGSQNKVLQLQIHPKGSYKLYSFNGGRYFVTANHPLMTTDGWKAIDPDAALRTVIGQVKTIGQLKVGDTLVTRHGFLHIRKIKSKIINNTSLYNTTLERGHDFYANGFLVHNDSSTFSATATDITTSTSTGTGSCAFQDCNGTCCRLSRFVCYQGSCCDPDSEICSSSTGTGTSVGTSTGTGSSYAYNIWCLNYNSSTGTGENMIGSPGAWGPPQCGNYSDCGSGCGTYQPGQSVYYAPWGGYITCLSNPNGFNNDCSVI